MRASKSRIALLVLCAMSPSLRGQAVPSATSSRWNLESGASVSANAVNSQLPYYADNSLGFTVGAFVQSFHLIGAEVRGGFYPISARFQQAPVTAGLRVASRRSPGIRRQFFGYLGGGISRAQDSGPNFQPMPASWSPCWQVSTGLDFSFRRFSWRPAEISWTETFGPRNDIRSLSASTGLVYRFGFGRNGERSADETVAIGIARTPNRMSTDGRPIGGHPVVNPQ